MIPLYTLNWHQRDPTSTFSVSCEAPVEFVLLRKTLWRERLLLIPRCLWMSHPLLLKAPFALVCHQHNCFLEAAASGAP